MGVAAPNFPEVATMLLCAAVRCCMPCVVVRCALLRASVFGGLHRKRMSKWEDRQSPACSLRISFAFIAVLPFSSSNVAAETAVQRPSFREDQSKAEYHENQSDPEYHKRSSANAANSTLVPLVSAPGISLVRTPNEVSAIKSDSSYRPAHPA